MTADPTSTPPSPWPQGEPPPSEAWRRQRHHWERHHHHHHRLHGVIPGLVVIAWGGILLLRELGVVNESVRAFDLWPLILVGIGLSALLRARSFGSVVFGLAAGLFGAGLLAERLGHPVLSVGRLWPIAIIAIGVGILLQGFTHRRHHQRLSDEKVSADELRRAVTMGGLSLVVDSQQFKGGELRATMAEVKIDLRRAALAGGEVTLDLALVMSGVELRVPPSWQVVNDVSPMMGAVEDQTEPRPDGAGVQQRLLLRGNITMGAVTIKN
jgi:predicted membrane protein